MRILRHADTIPVDEPTVAPPEASSRAGVHRKPAPEAVPTSHRRLPLPGWNSLILVLLIIVYLVPRLTGLDRVMTVDESFWLGRSANFYEGLANGHFEDTYQFAHPGVVTMWAGTIGFLFAYPAYPDEHPAQIGKEYAVHEDLQALGRSAMDILIAGRVVKILFQAALFALGFWLARGVFGSLIATLGALLIALNPFLIGHDRLLHIDSLCAVAAWVSLMALLRYVESPHRPSFLALSAVVAALAWLTRTPAVILVPVVMAVLLWVAVDRCRSRAMTIRAAVGFLATTATLWLASAALTTYAAWPALWTAPGMVARRMYDYSREAAEGGHEAGIYFNGETYRGDPGLLYYPVSLLYRLTPVTLAGLAIVLLGLLLRSRIVVPRRFFRPVAILALFAVLYIIAMSLGAKKFDRYILPASPGLDIIAAVGIVGLGNLIRARWPLWRRDLGRNLVVVAAVAGQLASAFSMAPYYLPYFNPLVGGTAGAEEMLLLGWGEGMDQVADFIARQPNGEHAVVHTSNARVSLIYVAPSTMTIETHAYGSDIASVAEWAEADYYVAYVSQWQRQYYSLPIDYLAQFEPVHVVSFGNTAFARVYDLNAIPPPPTMIDALPCSFGFGNQLTLLGLVDERVENAEGTNRHRVSFFFATGTNASESYRVRIDLQPNSGGLDPVSRTVTLHPASGEGMLSQVDLDLEFPGRRTTRSYTVSVTLLDPTTGEAIPATRTGTGEIDALALMTGCEPAS